MPRLLMALFVTWMSASPLLAQEAPPGIRTLLDTALPAVNSADAGGLAKITEGDPHRICAWAFPPVFPRRLQFARGSAGRSGAPPAQERESTGGTAGGRVPGTPPLVPPTSPGTASRGASDASPGAGGRAARPAPGAVATGPDRSAAPAERQGPSRRGTWKVGAIRVPATAGDHWVAVFWDFHPTESVADHVHRLIQTGDAWKLGPEIPETETFGFRLRDHRLTLVFDLPAHGTTITDEVLVQHPAPAMGPLQLRLSADFTVDSVRCNDAPLPFEQAGGVIYLAPPPAPEFRLALRYHGEPNHSDRFVGNLVDSSEIALTAYWYPTIARLPATSTVTATVPRGWTVIAQGDLVERRDNVDSTRFTYRMPVANCYFTLDAGPYYLYESTVNHRRYQVCLLKPDSERAEKQLRMMDPSFRLFERLWGPYPFDHYTIVETQQPGWAGALEAYTFTTYQRGMLPSSNPHEWGHSWWGGLVPNTYLQDTWNEAFASYSESVYYRYGSSPNRDVALRVYRQRPSAGMELATAQMSLEHSPYMLVPFTGTIAYGKGALVLQNLEDLLGFARLMKCMRAFRERHTPGEAATWGDFEKVVIDVSGTDLKWWFDQWIRRKGLPRLSWGPVRTRQNGDVYDIQAEIRQKGEPYRLSVPVWLVTAGGQILKSTWEVRGASTTIQLRSPAAPIRLILDPEIRLPREVTSQELGATVGLGRTRFRTLVVYAASEGPPEGITPGGSTNVKSSDEVTDAEVADTNVILMGNAVSNKLWARWAAHCPFSSSKGTIIFQGKAYPGAEARATTVSPVNPARTVTWISGHDRPYGRPNAETTVFDRDGHLLDARESIVRVGPSVYEFNRAPKPMVARLGL